MRLPVLGSSFLYLLAVDSLDVLNPRNSSVCKKNGASEWLVTTQSIIGCFEWAADLMTRYAHVGDLGKTAVQLIRGSKSSRNIAKIGEQILYKPLKISAIR